MTLHLPPVHPSERDMSARSLFSFLSLYVCSGACSFKATLLLDTAIDLNGSHDAPNRLRAPGEANLGEGSGLLLPDLLHVAPQHDQVRPVFHQLVSQMLVLLRIHVRVAVLEDSVGVVGLSNHFEAHYDGRQF